MYHGHECRYALAGTCFVACGEQADQRAVTTAPCVLHPLQQARRLCTQLSSAASRALVPHTSAAPARLFATQASTTPAILFDIDGVLLRGSEALPGAKATLERLESAGIPFAMLTNGGGCPEAEKAEKVSSILGHHIRPDRIILAHSPMRALVDTYKNDLVLVVGKDRALALAEAYGFNRVMTVTELHAAHAVAFPDRKPLGGSNFWYSDEELPIRAVMGFLDPEDYHRDLQVGGGSLPWTCLHVHVNTLVWW